MAVALEERDVAHLWLLSVHSSLALREVEAKSLEIWESGLTPFDEGLTAIQRL